MTYLKIIFFLIWGITIIGCGGIKYSIKNNTNKPVAIFIESYDTSYFVGENRFLQIAIGKNYISNYVYKINSFDNISSYTFHLNPNQKVVYKTGSSIKDKMASRARFIGYKKLESGYITDTILYTNFKNLKIDNFTSATSFFFTNLFIFSIEDNLLKY